MKRAAYVLLGILLSACAATRPTPSATPKVMDTTAPEVSHTPTVTAKTTVQSPAITAMPAATIEIDLTEETQNSLMKKFPVQCKDYYYIGGHDLSPDKNWLAASCGTKRNQTLEVVGTNGKHWVLKYKDYLAKGFDDGGPGHLNAAEWSSDSHYLYFTIYISYDEGGTCFYGYGIHGLFRIDVETGTVSTVLPATESFTSYYITFSPSGRRLAYQGDGNPTILDLQSGIQTIIDLGKDSEYLSTGSLTWSPDGLELAYATCEVEQDNKSSFPIKNSTIKIFSIKQQSSRTVLEVEKMMFFIHRWDTAGMMQILQSPYGFVDGKLELLDLNSHQLMTPTPAPEN